MLLFILVEFTTKDPLELNEKFEKSDFLIFFFFLGVQGLAVCFDGYMDGGEGKVVYWLTGLVLIEGGIFWVRVVE